VVSEGTLTGRFGQIVRKEAVPLWDSDRLRLQDISMPSSASQFANDVPGQKLLNLAVSRHGLRNAGARVVIPIVPAAMSQQHAAVLL